MIKQFDKELANTLVSKGLFSKQHMEDCLSSIQTSNHDLRSFLLKKNLIPERKLIDVMAQILNLETVDLRDLSISKSLIEKVPVRIVWYFKIMPLKLEGNVLTLATTAPLDIRLQDEIRVHLGVDPKFVLARETEIFEAINKYYGLAADTIYRLSKDASQDVPDDPLVDHWVEDLDKTKNEASIAKLVNEILLDAFKKRSTDIHIEPYRNKVRVRYRIDGVLSDANIPVNVKAFLPSIISRLKIMANLSIVEKRIPQDGSAVVKTKQQDLDLRISTIPTPHGESMVIRLLPTQMEFLNFEKLGLGQRNLHLLKDLLKKNSGIVLVTGPTGSGKTTTLYACLSLMNSPERKIITLEDPIEYEIEGVTQIQINPKVNMDFAAGLRSILRHDPDVIMVGEVRDLETAEIAIRTALTGHLVFSTLHTNDAASGITRLLDMGLEPFLLTSSIEAFIAQRLIRMICPKCREEIKIPMLEVKEEIVRSLNIKMDQVRLYRGRGCDYCNRSGYYGRTAIYEILFINEAIRDAILKHERASLIKKIAVKQGMLTLRQDGWRKVIDGVTTPEEVLQATVPDDADLFLEEKEEKKNTSLAKEPEAAVKLVTPEVLKTKNEYESRTYNRFETKVGIRFFVLEPERQDPTRLKFGTTEHASVTKDISCGGLRFVSGYALDIGKILDLKIYLDNDSEGIHCLARVCRVDDDAAAMMFDIAVFYLDISSADKARISKFINEKFPKETKS